MGCDIHAYIDYDTPGENPTGLVSHLCEINLWRNYYLFGLLAGVRSGGAMFEPRGLPERLSWSVRDEAVLYVSDENPNADGYCSRDQAEKWDSAHKVGRTKGVGGYTDEKEDRIYHPDWHTHSWLTTQELRQVVDRCKELGGVQPSLTAAIAAMEALEEQGCVARFIFWFDN